MQYLTTKKMGQIYTTAGALRAVLAFIDPEQTPKIAYDRDDLALPLIEIIQKTIGDKDGSKPVILNFGQRDKEIQEQFNLICGAISGVFDSLKQVSQ